MRSRPFSLSAPLFWSEAPPGAEGDCGDAELGIVAFCDGELCGAEVPEFVVCDIAAVAIKTVRIMNFFIVLSFFRHYSRAHRCCVTSSSSPAAFVPRRLVCPRLATS